MENFIDLLPDDKKSIGHEFISEAGQIFSGEAKPTFWKGYRFIPGFEAKTAEYVYNNVEFQENSVFVVTFPKTGMNWCCEIVREMLYGLDEKLHNITKMIPPNFLFVEMASVKAYEIDKYIPLPRRMYGSHLPEELFNLQKIKRNKGKVVYMLRNPKDQAISLFHFMKNQYYDGIRDEISSDWSEYFNSYVQGKLPQITKEGQWYLDHVLGWYKHKDDKDVLFVHFEDMKRDPKKEISRIAKFLDVELCNVKVEEIAEKTSFTAMKERADSTESEDTWATARRHMNLIRKGEVGAWKDTFTVAQSELVDKLIEEKLGDTDIKFSYQL